MHLPSTHPPRLSLVAALVLGACVSLPKPEPVELFAIDPTLDGEPASGTGPSLLVSATRAGPGLDGRGMVYLKAPHQPRYFARSQWVEPPARMVGASLARALERTGRFQAVTAVALGSRPGLRLESEVVRLQQEFASPPSRVRFTLRLELVDVAAQRIVGAREFEATAAAPSDDAAGGAAAANEAVRLALKEAAGWCAELGDRARASRAQGGGGG